MYAWEGNTPKNPRKGVFAERRRGGEAEEEGSYEEKTCEKEKTSTWNFRMCSPRRKDRARIDNYINKLLPGRRERWKERKTGLKRRGQLPGPARRGGNHHHKRVQSGFWSAPKYFREVFMVIWRRRSHHLVGWSLLSFAWKSSFRPLLCFLLVHAWPRCPFKPGGAEKK